MRLLKGKANQQQIISDDVPEDGKDEHDKRIGKVEVEAEEADDKVSERHATYSVERVRDVRRSKEAENELDGVLGVSKAKLDHVEKPATNNTT